MTIQLVVQPPFREDWTTVTICGDHEEEIINILVARLFAADFEVQIEADGELVPFEEFDLG